MLEDSDDERLFLFDEDLTKVKISEITPGQFGLPVYIMNTIGDFLGRPFYEIRPRQNFQIRGIRALEETTEFVNQR
tara:strand:+ start:151 stop:378 length:228 start_codon:yes stop_codon:yes gene_type:complete